MKNLILTCLMLSVSIIANAQDIIVKKGSEEIKCKVSEIGSAEIKYHKWENIQGPLYTIKKSDVLKIKFENGTEEVIQQEEFSVISDRDRRVMKRAITTRPFSPLAGHLCIGYQQAVSSSRSVIGEIGWIGPRIGDGMFDNARDASGAYARVGFRLKRSPEVVMEGMEWGFNLAGVYVQPELSFSFFSEDKYTTDGMGNSVYAGKANSNSGAFLITIGRQMIIGDIMTFDLSGSIGYGYRGGDSSSSNLFEIDSPIYYSHNVGGSGFPIAWNLTFSMGFLMK